MGKGSTSFLIAQDIHRKNGISTATNRFVENIMGESAVKPQTGETEALCTLRK